MFWVTTYICLSFSFPSFYKFVDENFKLLWVSGDSSALNIKH